MPINETRDERLPTIRELIAKKAIYHTYPGDYDDFISDAVIGILEMPTALWDNANGWIANRGVFIARRKRNREYQRKTKVLFIGDDDYLDYLLKGQSVKPEKETYWHEIMALAEQLPGDLAELFHLIVEGLVTGEAKLSGKGAIRQSWLCRQTGISSSTIGRKMAQLRLALRPLAPGYASA